MIITMPFAIIGFNSKYDLLMLSYHAVKAANLKMEMALNFNYWNIPVGV